MPAKAVIEAIRPTKDQLDDHPVVEVDLTVRTEQGNVFSASLRTAVPAVRLPEFRPGWTIGVKYAEIDGRMKVEAADAYVP